MTHAESNAMREARDAAQQTPPAVRTAFLAGPVHVAGHALGPLAIGHLWLLEAIEHPLLAAQRGGMGEIKLGIGDLCSGLYIFAKPLEARRALGLSREEFDDAAGAFADTIPASALADIPAALTKLVTEGLATAPMPDGKGDPRD